MIDVEKYLAMDKDNPEFIRDFDDVVFHVGTLRDSGDITHNKYMEWYNKLHAIKSGVTKESILKAFTRYTTIKRKGFYNLDFSEEELLSVIKARQVCDRFYRWADLRRHQKDNNLIITYLNNLSVAMINKFKENAEDKWSAYATLRNSAIYAVTRNLVSRVKMDGVANVVLFGAKEEADILYNQKPNWKVNRMNFFEGDIKKVDFDLVSIGPKLLHLYLTNLIEYEKEARIAHDALDEMYNQNKLDKVGHNWYYVRLNNYSYYLYSYAKIEDYLPIITYSNAESGNGKLEDCLLYNSDQMVKAIDFSREFFRLFTDTLLENEMIVKKLKVDLSRYGNKEDVNKFFLSRLNYILDAFLKYGVISSTKYAEYKQMGKEKFK